MFLQHLIYAFLWILVAGFSVFLQILHILNIFNSNSENAERRYDFVIIGGGSAGSILAGRLSEMSNVTVLLIEAGDEGIDLLNIPVLGPLKQLTVLDWQYTTVPQKHACFGLEKNISKWPSGKILGGSTHLNYMIHHRGHRKDYKSWKDPDSQNWDFNDIQFYFDKANKCVGKKQGISGHCSGKGNVKNSLHFTKLSDAILEAAKELGYIVRNSSIDMNPGFMKPHLYLTDRGERWTSDKFIRRMKAGRKNLHVMTNAVVEEILLLNGFEAHAVKIQRHGSFEIVHANFEIVVSAGSIGSPKLLMLSGIGPANSLANSNISAKIDLPVGENLKDHVTTGLDLGILKNNLFSFFDLINPLSAYEYFFHAKGPFTSGLVDAIGMIHSDLVDSLDSSPDLQFMVMMAGVTSDKGVFLRNSMGISQRVWLKYFDSLLNESVISILPILLHPKSTGQIILNPKNPSGMPLIDPNYLSDERDVTTLVEGIKLVRKMMATDALTKFGVRFNTKVFPDCDLHAFDSDPYWRCYVRHLTLTVYHPVGTCKMEKLQNRGVVDHRLKVHGTNKLRVIDASVMPTLPSANPMSAVEMIAEKGADMIKEDHRYRLATCKILEIFGVPRSLI